MSVQLNNIYENMLRKEVDEVSGDIYDNIKNLERYPIENAKKVLEILIQSACIGQNCAPIELARRKIGEINHQWIIEHFIETADACINYLDEWEYRRLVELTVYCVPELKSIMLEKGRFSENAEVREVVDDYSDF